MNLINHFFCILRHWLSGKYFEFMGRFLWDTRYLIIPCCLCATHMVSHLPSYSLILIQDATSSLSIELVLVELEHVHFDSPFHFGSNHYQWKNYVWPWVLNILGHSASIVQNSVEGTYNKVYTPMLLDDALDS